MEAYFLSKNQLQRSPVHDWDWDMQFGQRILFPLNAFFTHTHTHEESANRILPEENDGKDSPVSVKPSSLLIILPLFKGNFFFCLGTQWQD